MKRILAIISFCFFVSAQGMKGGRAGEDLFKVLGVSKDATDSDIQKAYYKLARIYHPDKNQDKQVDCVEKMKRINAAYAILRDPKKRKEYEVASLFNFSVDDMVDDIIDDFGVDRYREEEDLDFTLNKDEKSCGSSDEESYDSEEDGFNEERYQKEGARLFGEWKSFYKEKVHDKDIKKSKEKTLKKLTTKRKTLKPARTRSKRRVVVTW